MYLSKVLVHEGQGKISSEVRDEDQGGVSEKFESRWLRKGVVTRECNAIR